jgi:ribonuclease P protein component
LSTFSFQTAERLKSKKMLGRLFKEGNSFIAFPLRVLWLPMDALAEQTAFPAQVAIGAPKRLFKTAVARNLLKRRIREAYRLQKAALYDKLVLEDRKIAIAIMYIGKEELGFEEISGGIRKMIRKI